MANKDYERMIELGKWLERYLDPDIKPDEYKKLAEDAIRLYNFDFQLKKNDGSLMAIDYLYQLPAEIQEIMLDQKKRASLNNILQKIDWYFTAVFFPFEVSIDDIGVIVSEYEEIVRVINLSSLSMIEKKPLLSYLNIIKIILGPILSFYQKKNLVCIDIVLLKNCLFHFTDYKKPILHIFKNIYSSGSPWYQIFKDALKQKNGVKTLPREDPPEDPAYQIYIGYNMSNKAILFEDDGPVEKLISFFIFNDLQSINGPMSLIPWDAFSSKIALDFLLLGGQDYILFCEYCGKFTSIQRKGRKKYCSDICRVSHRNAELAKR